MTAEDHYVKVIGDGRSEMVLMSLSEAAELVPPGAGLRVHRSWWVAQSAIAGSEKSGRDTKIVLETGLRVPVARGRGAQLKDAGLI